MQMAETNPEITFESIQKELQITEEEVEAFIIEGKVKQDYYETGKVC